jgi:hypothetical protein
MLSLEVFHVVESPTKTAPVKSLGTAESCSAVPTVRTGLSGSIESVTTGHGSLGVVAGSAVQFELRAETTSKTSIRESVRI